MTEGRFGHAVVNVAGVVYAVGGDSKNPHHALASIEEFSPGSAEWRLSATKLITPRTNFGYTLVPRSVLPGCGGTEEEN